MRLHDQLSENELRKALIAHVRSESSKFQDERDVACPTARPDPDVMLVRSFSTTSRPALRAAACGGRPRPGRPTPGRRAATAGAVWGPLYSLSSAPNLEQ